MKNHVLRIHPSAQQNDKLWKHANAQNRLYNHFLDEHINAYAKYKHDLANNIANPVKPKTKYGRS